MRKGKKQYLDPATASNELVEHVLSKAYVEAEEAMVKGAKLDYLVKIDDGSAAEKQRTAFHRIVESGDPEAIEWAAAKGATPNVPMDGCTTIVHWCVEQNKAGTLQKLCALKLAGSLARLDVSKRDKSGETPTQAAIRLLRVDLAHTLLKAGADHDFNEKSYAPPGPATPSPSPSQPTEDPAPDPPPSDEVPAPVATPLNQVQYAVCAGELELVDTLFCLGVSPFQRDYKGRPLLHLAVEGECWPVVDALLDKKVPIDVPSTRGETALELALQKVLRAQTGGSAAEAPAPPAKDAAEQAAAKPGKTAGRPDKKVPEVAQSGLDVLAKLVSKGAAVNVLKRTGSPLWHGALHQGAEAVVAFFLDHGASVTLPDALGNTALHAAALLPGSRVLKLLFQHGEKDDSKKNAAPEAGAAPAVSIINKQNAAGDTPLHVACRSNRKAAAAFLLTFPAVCQNTKNNQGSTPLHLAARVGAVESGAELLKKSLVAIPETPASPSAASKAKPPAGGAAAKKQKDLAPAEPTASTEVDVEDNNGDTPLQVAMAFDQKDMVRLLIEHHASVQRKSVAHGTLLHQSITNGTVDITKSLIAGGASVHARDAQDRTPLHNAVLKNCEETVTVLLARDSLVDSQESAHGYAPLHIAAESNACAIADALIGKKASLEPRDHTCRTPLHLAALSGAVEVMASLIRHGAAVNTVDILDRTPLHIACEAARPGAVKLLLEHGADVSLPDRHKWSALHVASHAGSVACAELLIAAGAHLNEPDYRNRTPLILASEACKVDMGKLLVNSWAKGTQKETASA